MADSTNSGENEKNKAGGIDLSALQNFNFATNWSEASAAPSGRADRDSGGRGEPRRDRRPQARRPFGDNRGRPDGDRREQREAQGGRGERPAQGDRGRPERRGGGERPPAPLWRDSPYDVQVYPDDAVLTTLTRAMRHSLRTYELFEIARLVLEKPDRYHASIRFKEAPEQENRLLYQSVPDGLPFVTEDAAIEHVLHHHLEQFFTKEQVEVEPPKGTFQFIARCNITGEFLSPPNYHRYQSILLQYHQERFSDMPFERFRASVETVKDEEAVQKWLASMTTQTRYKVAGDENGEVFESLEQARTFLLRNKKDSVVRAVKVVKLAGKKAEEICDPAIKPYVASSIDHQRRFPLDTANALRGRLRRQDFFIYKKGSRGISYVCAVKRRFRQEGQVFSDSVENLLTFVEQNDMIPASELAEKFLGLEPAVAAESPAGSEAETKVKRMSIDLRWLLSEGYITEFSDGKLQAHPAAPPRSSGAKPDAEGEGDEVVGTAPDAAEAETAESNAKPDEASVEGQAGAEKDEVTGGEPEAAAQEDEATSPTDESTPAEPGTEEKVAPKSRPGSAS
jgi:hypothetical protein